MFTRLFFAQHFPWFKFVNCKIANSILEIETEYVYTQIESDAV